MLHLPAERLAALADHDPSPAEAEHLALCTACCRERDAYRSLLALAAAERDTEAEPLLGWNALAGRLRDERMLPAASDPDSDDVVVALRPAVGRGTWSAWPRAAAAVLLLAAAVAAGRVSTSVGPFASPRTAAADSASPQAGEIVAMGDTASEFGSQAEALQAMGRAERVYQTASAYLARAEGSALGEPDPDAYRTRLAALDEVAEATREALREAPHDPVINRYYLTTLGARQATLQQLGATLASTQGQRLTRF
jgi:hypothetical protein